MRLVKIIIVLALLAAICFAGYTQHQINKAVFANFQNTAQAVNNNYEYIKQLNAKIDENTVMIRREHEAVEENIDTN